MWQWIDLNDIIGWSLVNSEWYIGGKAPNNKKQKPNNTKIQNKIFIIV